MRHRGLLADKLKLVRKYTGDRFSAAKGYDLRRPISKARARTIAKYYDLILELTSRPHKVITPPKDGKLEAFEYTGQKGYAKFTKAIVETPEVGAKYKFFIDKTRPKGSRFIVENKKTREISWNIPARVFIDENPELFDPDAELDPTWFEDVIKEYVGGDEWHNRAFLIEAGESHMWGDAGSPASVGRKLAQLFKTYGAGNFNPMDKASHFIGNWFRGIKVFDPNQFGELIQRPSQRAIARYNKWGLRPHEHYRRLRSGDVGRFYKGDLVETISLLDIISRFDEVALAEYGLVKVENK